MSLLKRIKNLWYISGLDFTPSKATIKARTMIKELTEALSGKKMAQIIDTKEVDLFPNQEENERDTN